MLTGKRFMHVLALGVWGAAATTITAYADIYPSRRMADPAKQTTFSQLRLLFPRFCL